MARSYKVSLRALRAHVGIGILADGMIDVWKSMAFVDSDGQAPRLITISSQDSRSTIFKQTRTSKSCIHLHMFVSCPTCHLQLVSRVVFHAHTLDVDACKLQVHAGHASPQELKLGVLKRRMQDPSHTHLVTIPHEGDLS